MSHLELIALVVRDYDAAIRFFVEVLQFELVEDTPSLTNDGRPKRWVVIRPDGGQTGILLARADGDQQTSIGPAVRRSRRNVLARRRFRYCPTSAWSPPVCDSSRRLAMSHTADLQYFWILRGTAGTSWDESRGDRRQSARARRRNPIPRTARLKSRSRSQKLRLTASMLIT